MSPTTRSQTRADKSKNSQSGGSCLNVPTSVARPASSTKSSKRRIEAEKQILDELRAEKFKVLEEIAHKKLELQAMLDDVSDDEAITECEGVSRWVEEATVHLATPYVPFASDPLPLRERPVSTASPPLLQQGNPSTALDPKLGNCHITSTPNKELPPTAPTFYNAPNDIQKLAEALQCSMRLAVQSQRFHELPVFTGKANEWLAFKAAYDESARLYNLTSSENLARLRACLKGEAREAVSSLLITNTDPSEVMDSLYLRFGNQTLILREQLRTLRYLPRVRFDNLSEFTSKVNNCITTIKSLQTQEHLFNPELYNAIIEKMDNILLSKWYDYADKKTSDEKPIIITLNDFLKEECSRSIRFASYSVTSDHQQGTFTQQPSVRPSCSYAVSPPPPPLPSCSALVPPSQQTAPRVVTATAAPTPGVVNPCCFCNESNHSVVKCEKFISMTVDERRQWAKDNKKCFRCLVYSHLGKNCKISKYLHILLRFPKNETNAKQSLQNVNSFINNTSTDDVCSNIVNSPSVYLKVIPVTIAGPKKTVNTFALLDEGATITLIDANLAQEIGTDGPSDSLRIQGVTFDHSEISKKVQISIRGRQHSQLQSYDINARTMHNLKLSPQSLQKSELVKYNHIKELENSIDWYSTGSPKILIGQDNWSLIVTRELRSGEKCQPVLSYTSLGWVLHGSNTKFNNISSKVYGIFHCGIQNEELNALIKQSFELDNLGIQPKQRTNPDHERALSLLQSTTKRLSNNRWETGLLWKSDDIYLPNNSYNLALKRFYNLEKKFRTDTGLAVAYSAQINRLLENDYAELCKQPDNLETSRIWYLPHFPVINPNKPGKVRPVFDAAAKIQDVSLNDNLISGPDLLQPLLGVLWKFRLNKVAMCADIRDMFLRIKIRHEDQEVQKFIWREPTDPAPPKVFKLTSMLFGAACSPCSAIFVKNKNAEEFQAQFPEAVAAIQFKHYMDDYLDSVQSDEEAIKLAAEIIQIHSCGGFEIRSWASNSEAFLNSIPKDKRAHENIDLTPETAFKEKILGLYWEPATDSLTFNMSMHRVPANIVSGQERPTKRQLLSVVMSVFDPIGLIAPLTIKGRILLQEVWRSKVDWDDKIEDHENEKFRSWFKELTTAKECKVPRCYSSRSEKPQPQLHTFCDASQKAYAAACYLRYQYLDGEVVIKLVAAKAKVTPLKPISIPRLELQGALLGARLAKAVEQDHGLCISEKFFWTDSATTLAWIRSDPRNYKPYVGHRLSAIDELSTVSQWKWVPSCDNVADIATRDHDHTSLTPSSRWFNGPAFLLEPKDIWPKEKENMSPVKEATIEEKVHVVIALKELILPEVSKFSLWQRLIRATAYMLLFINKCRKTGDQIITADLLDAAEIMQIKRAQYESFKKDICQLRHNQPLSNEVLIQVSAYFDSEGVLRACGRIDLAPDVLHTCKRPIILDHSHPYTKLLLFYYHVQQKHASNETVVNEVKQKYYIARLRSTVRSIAHSCQFCKIKRATPITPLMGDLPLCRLDHRKRAFTHCGLDYFGPLEVTIGRRREKRYGALFTCMVTRAVHIEIAASLTSDAVIMAIRRMVSRRGCPSDIYSDNGTNFKGAERELKKAWKELNVSKIEQEITNKRIRWHFIPATAAHMGGAWERLVQSVKKALYATLHERAPREEVLATLMAEAEHTVNSRPLIHVSVDPRDPESLTPNHFLLGSSSGVPLPGKFDHKDLLLRKQWRVAQKLADMFWQRWLREYLPTLLPRTMNGDLDARKDLKIGDIVIVCDNSLPRNVWPKGVIVAIYPGKDLRVRVADVKTMGGIFRRPCNKLIYVPTEADCDC